MGRFRAALAAPGLGAIAEVKRRSPSAGDLRPDADPARLAAQFANAGAAAISVLVDERFGGSLDDLKAARAATSAPLLAKGFFTEELDLLRAKVAGADAVLVLLRDVDDQRAAGLMTYAHELGLETLVREHTMPKSSACGRPRGEVIGVNARPLDVRDRPTHTAGVDRHMTGHDGVIVAESGVHSAHGALPPNCGRRCDSRRLGAHARAEGSRSAAPRHPVPTSRQGLRAHTSEDVDAAVEAGADMLGFIPRKESPRRCARVPAVPDDRLSVAVFVGEAEDAGADLVQLYVTGKVASAGATPCSYAKARPSPVVDLLGRAGPAAPATRGSYQGARDASRAAWARQRPRGSPAVRPWAVDAASKLRGETGDQDHDKVRAFVEAAR